MDLNMVMGAGTRPGKKSKSITKKMHKYETFWKTNI